MAFYAAIWAMPVIAPIIAATMVFIVLASVVIGVGASYDFPSIATFGLVAVSAWLAGMTYRRVHKSFNPPQSSGLDMSPGYEQPQYKPADAQAPVTGQRGLAPPVVPQWMVPQ